jgi:hypothetical protein
MILPTFCREKAENRRKLVKVGGRKTFEIDWGTIEELR